MTTQTEKTVQTASVWDVHFGDILLTPGTIIGAIIPCPPDEAAAGERLVYDAVESVERSFGSVTYQTRNGWLIPSTMVYAFAVGAFPGIPSAPSFEDEEPEYVPDVYDAEAAYSASVAGCFRPDPIEDGQFEAAF